jgi:N-acyl homoserine lactone hydrolase
MLTGKNQQAFRRVVWSVMLLLGPCLAVKESEAAHKHPKAPNALRLYISDCGTIHTTNVDAYSLKKEEVGSTEMAIPCIIVAHPKGTLMWDNGDIPDSAFKPGGGHAASGVVTQAQPLLPQLAAVGYTPADITYLATSHYHGDHVANANAFAGSIWLVRKVERDRMFSGEPIPRSDLPTTIC